MPRPTDTQLVILTTAAQRDDGAILPLPGTLKANKGALAISLKSLLKRSLITERRTTPGDTLWRESDDGARFTLVITDTGLKTIGIDPVETCKSAEDGVPKKDAPAGAAGSAGKQQRLIDLLHRADGASLDELTLGLGWQAHSVRGAIAGTIRKKLGFTVLSEKHPGRGRVYRIAANSSIGGR